MGKRNVNERDNSKGCKNVCVCGGKCGTFSISDEKTLICIQERCVDGSVGTGISVLSEACKDGRDVFRGDVKALCGYALDGKALLLFVGY